MAYTLPDTDTIDVVSLTPTTKSNVIVPVLPWGRLYSTYIHLEAVDLQQTTFKLGRSEDCDVRITQGKVPVHRVTNISKSHFVITKEENLVYIQDLSKNGTYLNGRLIGRGNRNILQNDDEIAIGFKELKVYVFKMLNKDENKYLPPELRKVYQVSRQLGIGACGEVRLVIHKLSCRPYAIKKIVKARNSNSLMNQPDKIESEISILKTLRHPCVIHMEEVIETDEAVYIVLEYMEGGELGDLILSSRRLTEADCKRLFYQMVLAVEYLHDNGVTHRDLKPENVLLKESRPDTVVKLSDFGLSKFVDENSVMDTICGTPNYVAPEVIDRSLPCYTRKVDVWGLGVILFYMLSQELPFRSNDRAVLNKKIMTAGFSFASSSWNEISRQAKDLIGKMLVVDALQRISIKEILCHPWIKGDQIMTLDVMDQLYSDMRTEILRPIDSDEYSSSPSVKRSKLSDD